MFHFDWKDLGALHLRFTCPYLTPPGLHVEHVSRVMLQGDDLGERHVLVEELRTKAEVGPAC